MGIIVFLLGRPGSGKSSAARQLKHLAKSNGYTSTRICDYDVLFDWFQTEQTSSYDQKKRFLRTDRGGFAVIDFSVLDAALREVAKQAQEVLCEKTHDIVFIEFARDNYCDLLRWFNQDFLQNAFFLFLDADIESCRQRIDLRTTCAQPIGNDFLDDHPLDNHFVPDDIIDGYYGSNTQDLMNQLKAAYNLAEWQTAFIQNSDSWNSFRQQIETLFQSLIKAIILQAQQAQALPKIQSQPDDSVEKYELAEVR